jgi:hypothetical protein
MLLLSNYASSSTLGVCSLNTSLINQDPYPAIPGDYVKLVFQVNGVENPDCGDVSIKLNEAFPFTLDPGATTTFTANAGLYERDYSSFLIAPYKVRVDEEALDGSNPIEVAVTYSKDAMKTTTLEKFNVEIEDKRVDFEVYVKNYDTLTNILTLEVLNIGKADIKSLTIKIPAQENISIKGSNTNLLGDLDSNDYTTADFEATSRGGKINIEITYTDEINVRRTVNKSILFEASYFKDRKADEKSYTMWYIISPIVLIIIFLILYRRYKKGKKKHFD